jgi:protein CpxP
MNSIRFRVAVAALAVLVGTVVAKSQTAEDVPPPPPMHGHEFGMGAGFFAKQLNLTDDQKSQMKAVFEKERPTLKPLHEQERQLDQQLHAYAEGAFSAEKVQALAAQKAQIQSQLTVAETRIHNEMYQLLTPEQQSQLKQLEADREARMQQRMQEHMQQAPPPPPSE